MTVFVGQCWPTLEASDARRRRLINYPDRSFVAWSNSVNVWDIDSDRDTSLDTFTGGSVLLLLPSNACYLSFTFFGDKREPILRNVTAFPGNSVRAMVVFVC